MTTRSPRRQSHPAPLLTAALVATLVLFGPACFMKKEPPTAAGAEEAAEKPIPLDVQVRELETRTEEQDLHLLEKEFLIRQLEARLVATQQLLEEAIQDVVRANSRQHSVESRAEAASEMAEAEVALKALRDRATGAEVPEMATAEELVAMGAGEFENENFAGALYLASQAKGQIKAGTQRLGRGDPLERLDGEMPFVVPLPLTVNTRSNLREGPGRQFGVLATLNKGAPLTGFSTKGSWMRVASDDGKSGWIHLSLVTAG